MVSSVNTPTALQKLGLSREQVQAMAWRHQVQSNATCQQTEREEYQPTRLTKTRYLEAEEQRLRKAIMNANEAVIIGLAMQGTPVVVIALAFGVTDEAIRKRLRGLGICPPPYSSVGNGRLPVYRHVSQHEVLRVEIDDHQPKRKASAKKFDPRQLLFAWVN